MDALKLIEYRHPDKLAQKRYDSLIGIDDHKKQLLFTLHSLLDSKGLEQWLKKHHKNGLPYLENSLSNDPLIILSGDVGCGKTELAQSIASTLSTVMNGETITVFETPSNIRGGGHVGELSSRITAAFEYAKRNIKKGEYGILIIDEADDLVTNRDQMQAHHEDRSGVNVVIKEIDKIQREKIKLAVIMITNRPNALDPAVVRRASLQLKFERPDSSILKVLFERIFSGVSIKNGALESLINACATKSTPFSYSDISKRIAKQSMIAALQNDKPLSVEIILDLIEKTEPSPQITENAKV